MAATQTQTRKPKKNAPAEKPTPPPPEKKGSEIQFGTPIETDRLKVEFDGTTIRYTVKATGEVLEKDYGNLHAVMIIHGRISNDPHGPYTQACIGKIRAQRLKNAPL